MESNRKRAKSKVLRPDSIRTGTTCPRTGKLDAAHQRGRSHPEGGMTAMSWLKRLSNNFRGHTVSRQISEEIEFHLQERIDELIQEGMSERDARALATRQFGNP